MTLQMMDGAERFCYFVNIQYIAKEEREGMLLGEDI
jgi:hypothetical protein